MPADRVTLTLAHSPDPDDVFMWWPITGMIDPADFARLTRPPALDTGRFRFAALPADIAVLNRRAIESGDLDITALSMFAWAHVRNRYMLTACGSSMGRGYGPKVVARAGTSPDLSKARIAIPGTKTTAFLLLNLWLGRAPANMIEMPFDRILDAVSSGAADAGLLIHQSQLTFAQLGLTQLVDLGQFWMERTGLPLPLGGNAVRSDLDQRHGPGTTLEVVSLLQKSIAHALAHRDESTEYAMRFAPDINRAQADQYIDMYVNDLSINAGEEGRRAIERLLAEAASRGMCDPVGRVEMLSV